ncbi:MAG TPA: amidase [Actinomycetota bacterium]|nr:amidase [Actinomycetota bacterium]
MGLLAENAAAIAAGERSSKQVVGAALEAADRLQPLLNAFTMLLHDQAMAAAEEADGAARSGGAKDRPLLGVPVAVKDLYDVAGTVTSGCSRAYLSNAPAANDAHAVAALRRAGAIVIGKTNMHELAFGGTTSVSCFGPARNPWDPERMPGGSSGGSAAVVAARIVGSALGSDTGGSIRIPASFCGATGLKVSAGLLPLAGVLPMSPSLDTPGGIASDAVDLALVHGALAAEPVAMRPSEPVEGLRVIGVPTEYFFDSVDPEIEEAVRGALDVFSSDGVTVRPIPAPWAFPAYEAWLLLALAEFGRAHAALLERIDELDPSLQIILRAGAAVAAEDEISARDQAIEVRNAFAATMSDVQLIVTPSTPFVAPRHSDETITIGAVEIPVQLGVSHFTRPFSTIGAPAISIPCGATASGLPIGLQLIARPGGEHLLLRAAARYQNETGWHRRIPPNAA